MTAILLIVAVIVYFFGHFIIRLNVWLDSTHNFWPFFVAAHHFMPNHSFGGGRFNEENREASFASLCGRNAESSPRCPQPESVKTISSQRLGAFSLRNKSAHLHTLRYFNCSDTESARGGVRNKKLSARPALMMIKKDNNCP